LTSRSGRVISRGYFLGIDSLNVDADLITEQYTTLQANRQTFGDGILSLGIEERKD